MPNFDDFYGPKEAPGVKELGHKSPGPSTRVGAHPLPPWARPPISWTTRRPPWCETDAKNPINTETPRKKPRSGVPPLQTSRATKNQSRPCFHTLPEGGTITGGHLHHPDALHDEEGVVHPRGWGYVPVAMCLISLSRVLDSARSWCIATLLL